MKGTDLVRIRRSATVRKTNRETLRGCCADARKEERSNEESKNPTKIDRWNNNVWRKFLVYQKIKKEAFEVPDQGRAKKGEKGRLTAMLHDNDM